jgi:hypothetical protein
MSSASAARRAALVRFLAASAAVLVAALALLPTRSGAEERSAAYQAFAAQPGAELSQRTERGEEVYVARYRGVVLEERVREGRVQTFTTDHSGHGAVLCTWMIYISLRAQLSACNPGQHEELREDFEWMIGSLNAFIADNDPNREPLLSWQERAAAADARYQQHFRSNPQVCRNPDAAASVLSFLSEPREARRRRVTEHLSVPRPPASAPCL